MQKKTLLILAGGLGSRYNGLKQIDSILENGHVIMEYSLYDAIEAGFNKVVIIINPNIPVEFKTKIEKILSERSVELHWVIQETSTKIPEIFSFPDRQKPWGTSHAVLCAEDVIQEPFTIINADDYYGKEIYKMAADLIEKTQDATKFRIYNIAFPVGATATENGSVCRGICKVDENGSMESIEEICSIQKENEKVFYEQDGEKKYISPDTPASMNFWIFPGNIFKPLREGFHEFLASNPAIKQEYYIPTFVQELINREEADVYVELSPTIWKGVTYADDKQEIQEFLKNEITNHKYPQNLWN